MSTVGYTDEQARNLKERIDLHMARVADNARAMRKLVPDLGAHVSVEPGIEELREIATQLKATVDRRTRVELG